MTKEIKLHLFSFIGMRGLDRQGRKHKRNLFHLSEYILQELKENIHLLEKAEHLSSASEKDCNANHINNNDRPITKKEVSNSALKVGVSSSMFWDLPSNAQSIMLMLETAIDGYNKVVHRLHEITESVTLTRLDQQTASKVLRRYDADLSY